jgi:hypothetical protein
VVIPKAEINRFLGKADPIPSRRHPTAAPSRG